MKRTIIALALLALVVPSRAGADPVPTALRVTLEMHAGALSVAAGAGLGLLLSGTEGQGCTPCQRAGYVMVGGAIGAVAAPFAMLGVARLLGGQGDVLPTVIGFLAGMQLDAFLSVIVHKLVGTDVEDVPMIAWVLAGTVALAAPLVGSTIGAEW